MIYLAVYADFTLMQLLSKKTTSYTIQAKLKVSILGSN